MSDDIKHAHAEETFRLLCSVLDGEFEYEKDEEKLFVKFATVSEDVPIRIFISVDEKRQVLKLLSFIPLRFPPDKIGDACIAACYASDKLADGCFSVDINEGNLMFKQTVSLFNSKISRNTVKYLIDSAYTAIDKYNDKFLDIAENKLSVYEFISQG